MLATSDEWRKRRLASAHCDDAHVLGAAPLGAAHEPGGFLETVRRT
jgi:hypothetical protein